MRFSDYGYKEKIVKVREMTFADMIYTVGGILARADRIDMEIRVVDCYTGTVERWDGLKGLMLTGYTPDWRVKVYKMVAMTDADDGDYILIVLSSDDDDE